MTVKNSFQFLNTLCLGLKNKGMFLARQAYQIARAVVVSDTIKVMDYPALRQWFAVCLFPDKDMLKDISLFTCSWVVRSVYQYIARVHSASTLPQRMVFALSARAVRHLTTLPALFAGTAIATNRYQLDWLPAINTRMLIHGIILSDGN